MMSNESFGLEYNNSAQERMNDEVIRPDFEFKQNLESKVSNQPSPSTNSNVNKEAKCQGRGIIDSHELSSNVSHNGSDANNGEIKPYNRGVPVVIQQKYGASTYNNQSGLLYYKLYCLCQLRNIKIYVIY